MGRVHSFILCLCLLFGNAISVSAFENQEEKGYYAKLELSEVAEGDVQKVFLNFQEDATEIDLTNSYIEIRADEQIRIVKGIVFDGNTYYFQFPIEGFYASSINWQISTVILKKDGSILDSEDILTFKMINEESDKYNDEEIINANLIGEEFATLSLNSNERSGLLSDIKVESSNGYYTISGVVPNNIKNILCPTWTANNGQDDIIWKAATISHGTFTFIVDMKDHNGEVGEYITHVYMYDESGKASIVPVVHNLDYTKPIIGNVQIKDDNGRYTITGDVQGYGITSVLMPTWTLKNGQDDIVWHQAELKENKFECIIDMKDHKNELGSYITHIYAYDSMGNRSINAVNHAMKYDVPSILNVQVKGDNGRYTITADVEGYNLTKVQFPTWTNAYGQDDIKWSNGTIRDGKISYTVEMKDHKNETGKYTTHIYLYDALGNRTVVGLSHEMQYQMPEISNVQVADENGRYTITADVKGYNLTKVQFPTWTNAHGQDDIKWSNGTIRDGKISYTVEMKDHKNETGKYTTHIYLYDAMGNRTIAGVNHNVSYVKPVISNVHVQAAAGKYTITGNVSGYDIQSVKMPTWTSNKGQDDIKWHLATLNRNSFSCTVDMKDHNYETGNYITHIYAYDKAGNYTVYGISQSIVNKAPVISNVRVSDVTSQGYLITCTVTEDYALDQVLFPTWSLQNGQDDITWGKGNISGNTITYRVYIKDHKYDFGEYKTHIYAYDKAGLKTSISIPTVSINSYSTPGWKIVNGHKYLYDANGKIVGSGILVIDISEHNGVIDWTAVKNAGVDGVILRSSYGAADDFSQMDKKFKQNIAELNRLGIPYGIYHFSYATTTEHGMEEAKYVLKCLKEASARPTLPIYYDLESSSYVGDKSGSFYTELTKNFASVIRGAGYQVGVYANYNWWTTKLTDKSFQSYIKWVAHYGTYENNEAATANPYWHPTGEYKMWQYTSCGTVKGINAQVDMNIMY